MTICKMFNSPFSYWNFISTSKKHNRTEVRTATTIYITVEKWKSVEKLIYCYFNESLLVFQWNFSKITKPKIKTVEISELFSVIFHMKFYIVILSLLHAVELWVVCSLAAAAVMRSPQCQNGHQLNFPSTLVFSQILNTVSSFIYYYSSAIFTLCPLLIFFLVLSFLAVT